MYNITLTYLHCVCMAFNQCMAFACFRFLQMHKLQATSLTAVLLQNMQRLESCDPAVYHSVLLQALADYKPQVLHLSNTVKKTRAHIIEPGNTVLQSNLTFVALNQGSHHRTR